MVDFLDRNHFNYLARKYHGDKYDKHFACWNQLLTLMFGQLGNRESLRDIAAIIAYCLVAIVHHDKRLERSTYEVLQILGISLTDKTSLKDLPENTNFNDVKELDNPHIPRSLDYF